MKPLITLSPRQKRALQALCKEKAISSFDLEKVVGTTNIGEVISTLRKRGWDIETIRFEMVDRDGHVCRPGKYALSEDCKLEARRLFLENDTGAAVTALVSQVNCIYKGQYSKGGEL